MNQRKYFSTYRISLLTLAMLLVFVPAMTAHQVVSKGTPIDIRLAQRLDSEENRTGDTFEATLEEPLVSNGQLLAPQGALLKGELLEVKQSGKVKGTALMRMTLRSIEVGERTYPLESNEIEVQAKGGKKKDATIIGGGAGIGALLGAIIGGKKGAAIGAAVGAGAGTAVVLTTDGEEVRFEPEQRFRFFLEEDLSLPEAEAASPSTGRDPHPTDESQKIKAELHTALRELEAASQAAVREAERLLDQSSPGGIEDRFVISSFDSSLRLFSELWQERDRQMLGGAKQALLRHFESADLHLRRADLPDALQQGWLQVRAEVLRFDRLYDSVPWTDRPEEEAAFEGRLRWRGRIDGSDSIVVKGSEVTARHLDGRLPKDSSMTLSAPLPARAVEIELRKIQGRGNVRLIERPSRWNDYQAVVLLEDDANGADFYEFELIWK